MKQYREHDLVMLPNNNIPIKGDLLLRHLWKNTPKLKCNSLWQYKTTFIYKNGTKVFRTLNSSFEDYCPSFKPQHLYITSNDEIKEGDWVIFLDRKLLYQVEYTSQCADYNNDNDCKKIIATTNNSLRIGGNTGKRENGISIPLPQIPQQFIEYFITEYNKGNIIIKVLVEYEITPMGKVIIEYGAEEKDVASLTLNPDNTINIKPVKIEMYSRDKVIKLLEYIELQENRGFLDHLEEFDKLNNKI